MCPKIQEATSSERSRDISENMGKIDTLFEIVQTLRSENGCSWDQKQTPETMLKCLQEEVYELEEAIVKKDLDNSCEEMGDVLFQLVFIARIFEERGEFTFSQAIDQVARKMIRRHPHVYDDKTISTHEELIRQWESIKAEENREKGKRQTSALDNVPKGMPSLGRALKVSKCAVKEGFEWDDIHEVLDTARGELDEFEAALKSGDVDETMLEFGDVLFSLVNVARFAKFHPETALSMSTAKFEGRFRVMEEILNRRNQNLRDLSKEEREQVWEEAKTAYEV